MSVYLEIKRAQFNKIRNHLHQDRYLEQAVFLFLDYDEKKRSFFFRVDDFYIASKEDFLCQESDYLELTDEARSRIIKMAWDKGKALGEIHSHPMSMRDTRFSPSDLQGFKEFVPHVWWRLKNKPYLAIVSGAQSLDALAWIDNPDIPKPLREIRFEDKQIVRPTGRTMKLLRGGFHAVG